MLNLRVLIVKCADDDYYKHSLLTDDNDVGFQRLRDQLPSTYLIARDLEEDNNVLKWKHAYALTNHKKTLFQVFLIEEKELRLNLIYRNNLVVDEKNVSRKIDNLLYS